MKILILDDDDNRHTAFAKWLSLRKDIIAIHVKTAKMAIEQLQSGAYYDAVFLDHDLEDVHYKQLYQESYDAALQERTGYDVAKFIARELDSSIKPKTVVVHSWNPPGAQNMIEVLREDVGIRIVRWLFNPAQNPFELIGG